MAVVTVTPAASRPESLVRGTVMDAGALTSVTVEASPFELVLVGVLIRVK